MAKLVEVSNYVCSCGSTYFIISHTHIECSKCGIQYNYYHGYLLEPRQFNGRRESLKVKLGRKET